MVRLTGHTSGYTAHSELGGVVDKSSVLNIYQETKVMKEIGS